ncbi:hypothetical protein ANN_14322 [Periplaneta americana]|uniref:Uncharacterized protein n=1 Tax=Periplaneta americana TaxID=6978 RepID=A0ABQ8SXK3_PERAM|nr:hypothetical protein ANN_14322 [Periplaneta americana]
MFRYTLSFTVHHRKKSSGDRSGERAGHCTLFVASTVVVVCLHVKTANTQHTTCRHVKSLSFCTVPYRYRCSITISDSRTSAAPARLDFGRLKYSVYEEVHGTADDGNNRRIDIIAISEFLSQGMIIDPTIRFETYKGQPEEVHEEKRAIFVPTIAYYKDKYQLHDISVTGLMFGARGTIPNFFYQFSDVERSFSAYKVILSDTRRSFSFETLKMNVVVYCSRNRNLAKNMQENKINSFNNSGDCFRKNVRKYPPNSDIRLDLILGSLDCACAVFYKTCDKVLVITEDVQNVHLLLEYRPHIDVSLTCEHDAKLQEYCVCPQNMPQFDSEGIPNQAPETNKPMILNGPTSRNREVSDQVSVEAKQLGHLYLSIDQEVFDPSTGQLYD